MKVGHNFKVPEKYSDLEQIDIGGYKFIISPEEGILIQGNMLVNLFHEKIGIVGIVPYTKEQTDKFKDFPFEYDQDIIFGITYNDYCWYFTDLKEAYRMLDTIFDVKLSGLSQTFNK
jgi:hypothetical protein